MHESWEYLDKLVKTANSYDLILISGDQANNNNVVGEPADPELNRVAEESNKRIVESL